MTNFDLTRHGKFKVPDMWAAGVEWRPMEPLRVLVDYDRVSYSQLKEDFLYFQGIASGRPEQLVLEDGNELHAGFEYVFLKARASARLSRRILARPRPRGAL